MFSSEDETPYNDNKKLVVNYRGTIGNKKDEYAMSDKEESIKLDDENNNPIIGENSVEESEHHLQGDDTSEENQEKEEKFNLD